jgi:hypothetical protein
MASGQRTLLLTWARTTPTLVSGSAVCMCEFCAAVYTVLMAVWAEEWAAMSHSWSVGSRQRRTAVVLTSPSAC